MVNAVFMNYNHKNKFMHTVKVLHAKYAPGCYGACYLVNQVLSIPAVFHGLVIMEFNTE